MTARRKPWLACLAGVASAELKGNTAEDQRQQHGNDRCGITTDRRAGRRLAGRLRRVPARSRWMRAVTMIMPSAMANITRAPSLLRFRSRCQAPTAPTTRAVVR
jgi:hypothetical protein